MARQTKTTSSQMYKWTNGLKHGRRASRWALLAALVPVNFPDVAEVDDATVSICTDAGLRTAAGPSSSTAQARSRSKSR